MTDTIDIRIEGSTLRGSRTRGVCRFSGIRYAQPPVGTRRFSPPVSAPLTEGLIDATSAGAVAPQLPSRLRGAMGDFEATQSEDCLNLTVWTPAADGRRRPVLVWLHGGAWQSGAGALDWYDGARLAARGDIVVVAPNYRLAALGWLHLPGGVANAGLLDQEAALDWVVRYIEALGGDPQRITLMGQSAGAFSIACLLSRTPRFQRAILLSASLGRGFRPAEEALALAEVFLRAAGLHDIEQARQAHVATLLEAQRASAYLEAVARHGAGRSPFSAVADGAVLPIDAADRIDAFSAKVDVIIGHTRDELAAFPGTEIGEACRAQGDRIYGEPSRRWATAARAAGRHAWMYRLDYAPTARFGACHCMELPFVFGTAAAFAQAPMLRGAQPSDIDRLTEQVQGALLRFIQGDAPGWSEWPEQLVLV